MVGIILVSSSIPWLINRGDCRGSGSPNTNVLVRSGVGSAEAQSISVCKIRLNGPQLGRGSMDVRRLHGRRPPCYITMLNTLLVPRILALSAYYSK
jgi:hypothetical protein